MFESIAKQSSDREMEAVKAERDSIKYKQVEYMMNKIGESKIELLEATSPTSAIGKFINKRGEGLHHIAFEVKDIYAEMKRLQAEGFVLLNTEPKQGADNKLVAFLHPKDANGVLIELCQERNWPKITRKNLEIRFSFVKFENIHLIWSHNFLNFQNKFSIFRKTN